MAMFLDAGAADFEPKFADLLAAKREVAADVDTPCGRDHRRRPRARRRGADRLHAALRPADLTRDAARPGRGDRGGGRAPAPQARSTALEFAARASRPITARQMPGRPLSPTRSASSSAGAGRAIEAVGIYVPGGTAAYPSSVLMNAVPAKVAGVDAHRHGRADAGRRAQSAGAGGGAARRRRRDLPRRRRAGGRGARLWHGDDRAGRQDRRAGQRLCRGGQAAGLRHGRHRHDRRPVRDPGHRRSRQRSGLDRRRPARPGRARRGGAVDPDHRRSAASPTRSTSAVERAARRRCRAATIAAASWRDHGAVILVRDARRGACRWSTASRRSIWRLALDDAEALAAKMRNAGAIFLGRHTPEAIGDYVAGPNHVLPTARSGAVLLGPRRARFPEADVAPELRRRQPRAIGAGGDRRSPRPKGSTRMRARSRSGSIADAAERQHGRDRPAYRQDHCSTSDSVVRRDADIEHEREVAIYDLLEDNHFAPVSPATGPFHLHLAHRGEPAGPRYPRHRADAARAVLLPLSPFRKRASKTIS